VSNPFPYNQCVQAFTANGGEFSGYSFIVWVYHNGIGVAELQPTTTTSSTSTTSAPTVEYNWGYAPSLFASGDVNTAVTFLVNEQNQGSAPYYFLVGSTGGTISLYVLNPNPTPSAISSSNVTSNGKIASISGGVAGLYYDPIANILLVASATGNVSQYSVSFSSGTPTLTTIEQDIWTLPFPVGSNGQVQIAAPLVPPGTAGVYYITGAPPPPPNYGLLQFSNTAALNTDILGVPNEPTVAIAFSPKYMYLATADGLYQCTYPSAKNALTGFGSTVCTQIWNSSSLNTPQTITSLASSSVSSNPSQYPQGALLIGTYVTSGNGSNTSTGSVYVYNPAQPDTGVQPLTNMFDGAVYGLYVDPNGHALCAYGSTGLALVNIDPAQEQLVINLCPNTAANTSGSKSFWGILCSVAEITFGILTEDPAAVAWGTAGLICATADEAS